MLYLGIDLHSKQLTVNLRGEDGEVIMRRQVSTRGRGTPPVSRGSVAPRG